MKRAACIILLLLVVITLTPGASATASESDRLPTMGEMAEIAERMYVDPPEEMATPIRVLIWLTLLTFLPAMLLLMTSFTRIVIVISVARHALALQQAPPAQVVAGLSLFLTLFIMAPVFGRLNAEAIEPYLAGDMVVSEAVEAGAEPFRDFMMAQVGEGELELFVNVSGIEQPTHPGDVPLHVMIPAFTISELRRALEMGFVLFLPFLVLDLVVASILLSMGMMMLPPTIIAMPLKLLLFILVDGWSLLASSLIFSFG